MDGFTRTEDGFWTCDIQTLNDLVERAKAGDELAQRMACAMAGEYMQAGKPLPVALSGYIAGALWRFGNEDRTLKLAFSPLGRLPTGMPGKRKQASDDAILYWVEHAIASGLTTSKDGEIGPAFEKVAESLGLSPSTIKERYFERKRERGADANSKSWKVAIERAKKNRDS